MSVIIRVLSVAVGSDSVDRKRFGKGKEEREMINLFKLSMLNLITDRANTVVKDLQEAQRFNAQYHYDKERNDRLKQELESRRNIMRKKK